MTTHPLVHPVVLDRAREQPDAIAARDATGVLTYGELVAGARVVAARLRAGGVGEEALVGVVASRDRRLLVAVLGCWLAGAAFVPLDPVLPAARLADVLDQARPAAVLVPDPADTGALADPRCAALAETTIVVDDPNSASPGVFSGSMTENTPEIAGSSRLAYVMFTSGSTGRPKGVLVEHPGVLNLLEHLGRAPGLARGDTMLSVTSPAFDLCIPDLFLPLITGATVVFAPRSATVDGAQLVSLVEQHRPDLMQATPSTWRLLLAAGWTGAPQLRIVCGGEGYDAALARDLVARTAGVWNCYGPTETTVWSVSQQLTAGVTDPVPMGRPLPGTSCAVLGPDGSLVPDGTTGELWIGGVGVARGYLGRPDHTDAAFVAGPDGERGYRTGDLVRRDVKGVYTFVGREDGQVKLRGHRVELGDVENALRRAGGVAQVAVVPTGPSAGVVTGLVAYVVGADPTPEPEALRAAAADLLPPHMVPAEFVRLDAMPLTANRKIDRLALAARAAAPAAPLDATAGGPLEQEIAAVWADVLGVTGVGSASDFFALGGDSLAATRIAARLVSRLGVDIGVVDLFTAPTVAGLADVVLVRAAADLDQAATGP